jgi:hypothetical protein
MKLLFKFLIAILFLILVYSFYRSEIYWAGSKRHYYLIYYIGTLIVIFFLIICTYLNVKTQKYIIIIFISTIFTLYSFEGKLIFNQKKVNLNFDEIKKFDLYANLRKTNLNVTVFTPTVNFLRFNELDLLSLAGISLAKTIFCNENGYYSIYQSDRYGFNNPDKKWDSKEIEYILVGDSFAHGACVNMPNDIASVLGQYSKKNVLNLGYSGKGPLSEYATLREYSDLNIKKVLWLYYEGNDLSDLETELTNKILKKYLTNQKFKQDLKLKQNQINQFLTIYVEKEIERVKIENTKRDIIKIQTRIAEFIKLYNTRSLLITPPPPPPPLPELKTILNLANELVKSYNAKLYFIYLPTAARYTQSLKTDYKQEIEKIITDIGIEFIDIDKEVFKKEKNPIKLFPGTESVHYNIEGYKKVALKIYEKTKYN